MRKCIKCNVHKEIGMFHKGSSAGGYRVWCKTCVAVYKKQYRLNNAERIKKVQREYDLVQNPLRREYFHQRYINKREHILAISSAYKKLNPHKNAAREAKRRAATLQRTPKWVGSEEMWIISEAYALAKLRGKILGGEWEVDHIIPLQAKNVCGLHVPTNLQVIPCTINRQKSNYYEVAL